MNTYIVDDNINVLKDTKNDLIDMIYFDPPYNTGRNFGHFNDKFDLEKYKEYMQIRIQECHRVLKKSGCIIIHIEPKIVHHFRFICDSIFGDKNFRNEIIWKTGGNSKNKYQLGRNHDNIIVYSKSSKYKFNPIYFPYGDAYRNSSNVKFCEIHQKEYVTTAIHNSQSEVNPRYNLRYEWKGILKQWYVSLERMKWLEDNNRLEYNKSGIPRVKRFLVEMDGIPLNDVWVDISNTQRNEKLDYATQKPIKLLQRIVELYTDENDVCLDIFAGSGTLGRACLLLNRRYILVDINQHGKDIFDANPP